jgi:hypothetical protein
VVTITDASTNAVLDSGPRTFSNFHNGVYIGYLISGNVTITVTPVGHGAPAVSGVFFGINRNVPMAVDATPSRVTATAAHTHIRSNVISNPGGASFIGFDTTTQGNWKSTYGANGYFIANDGSLAPTYATSKVDGDPNVFAYTWGSGAYLTDIRALQIGNSPTGRIASEYTNYQTKSFTINVNINDGGTHSISLYLLDWDTTTRSEVITIRDLSTGTLLDTRVISNFHNGVYASWNISGNVVITVQPTGYTTPSVSGVFFNGVVGMVG